MKRTINRRGLVALLVSAGIAFALGVWGFNNQNGDLQGTLAGLTRHAPPSSNATADRSGQAPAGLQLGPPLSATPYVAAAYQIYPGPIDDNSRQALTGFTVSFNRQSSQVTMNVSVVGSSDPPVQRTFEANDKVYFIETRWGDDSRNNGEFNFGDDGLIITNADGRIILPH